MSINSDDLENVLDAETLKALGVEIDYTKKKVYITAHRDNVDFIKEYMNDQDFNFIGESVKIRYDHDGVGCQEPTDSPVPQDPIRCYEFSSSSSSSLGDEICTPSIEVDIYGTTAEGICNPTTETLTISDDCGCDESDNCTWRKDTAPSWYEVFDTSASIVSGTNHFFQQDDSFIQVKAENIGGNNIFVLRQVERTTYYALDFDPDIIVDDIIELSKCPCIFSPQKTSIYYNLNVLINIKEDFNSALNGYEYTNDYEVKTIAKIQGADQIINNCHGVGNIYQPNGVFVESEELYNQWRHDLSKGFFFRKDNGELIKEESFNVNKIVIECDLSSSSSSDSSFSSESSISGESTSSTSSSSSNSSSSSESSSQSEVSSSSSSSSSEYINSSSSSSSNSSSSSSFDERCEPKIYGENRFGQSVVFNENGSRVFVSSLIDAKIWVYDIHLPNPPTGVPGYTFVETISGPTNIDFGWSINVSADGSELIVGAPAYDNDKGRIYHYTYASGFSLSGSYTPPDAIGVTVENPKGDRFGHSVDVSSDGSYFAIGSPYNKNDVFNNGFQAGAVYVLDNTLTLREKVQPSDGEPQDVFGWDVSINVDGSRFVASSFDDDDLGIRSGSVYVFDWNVSSYDLNAKLTASDGDEEYRFGKSISIAERADVIIVGAYKDNNINGVFAGAVYEYRWDGSDWVETKIITNDSIDGSSFGFDVDVNACGNAFIATALSYQEPYEDVDGDIYVFTYNGSWTQELKFTDNLETTDRYGYVAAISENGIYIATSSPTYNVDSGMVHIYNLDNTCYSVSVNCDDVVGSSSSE